jgi:hypothetical protein
MPEVTIFGQNPAFISAGGSAGNICLTTAFIVSAAVPLTAVWYASPASAVPGDEPLQAGVFRGDTEALVQENTSPAWSGPGGSGWIRTPFDGSVTLEPGITYYSAVAFSSAQTAWGSITPFWQTGGPGAGGITSPPLTAPNLATQPLQGAVAPGAPALFFPVDAEGGKFFGVDVGVTPAAPPPAGFSLIAAVTTDDGSGWRKKAVLLG